MPHRHVSDADPCFTEYHGKEREMADRNSYYEKVEADLGNWDAEIRRLKENTRRVAEGGKIPYYDQLEDLMALQERARQTLQELRESDDEHWNDFRMGMETAMKDLRKSHAKLTSHFT
jgi:hypothetical protein